MFENRSLKIDVTAVALIVLTICLTASLLTYDPADPVAEAIGPLSALYAPDTLVYPQNDRIHNACGRFGALAADIAFTTLGWGAWYALGSLAFLVFALLRQPDVDHPLRRALGWGMTLVGLTALMTLTIPGWSPGPIYGAGGALGQIGKTLLSRHFAGAGSTVVALGLTIAGTMLATEYHVFRALVRAGAVALFGVDQYRSWLRARKALRELRTSDTSAAPLAAKPGAMNVRISGKTMVAARDEDDEEDDAYSEEDETGGVWNRPSATDIGEDAAADDEGVEDGEETPRPREIAVPAVGSLASEGAKAAAALTGAALAGSALASAGAKASEPLKIKTNAEKRKAMEVQRAEIRSKLDDAAAVIEPADAYQLPSIELLQVGDEVDHDAQAKEVRRKAKLIEKTFADFNLNVKVVEIETGPVIAQYEIELEPGLKLSKVTALADDLAIALRVPSVRVVAPIPGKNTVGIEVPNETRQTVRMREVIEEANGRVKKMLIPLFLGKDVAGNPLATDLAKLPHLLIAGSTGTGKSVCLNTIIVSMLMTRRPDEVRLLMIDPKQVELSGYGRLPHLMHPVVTDPKKAEAILNWAVEKMEERYTLLAKAGVRHITNYNQLGEEELLARLQPEDEESAKALPRNLPFIVIVVDEYADLMMTCGKEVELHISRLAQKSRAVGIHLILATQKPTVDVVTGLIKSNLPARICCKVTNRTDSRVVLDEMGAEKLLGMGDMLFLGQGTSTLLRGQGTYLSDDEINSVVEFVTAGRDPQFVEELVSLKPKDEAGTPAHSPEALKKRDPLYESAIEVVIREGRGSVSLLQRALGIGYGRAARLVDFMAEDGIVGHYNGSQAREVVISIEDWNRMRSGGEDGGGFVPTPAPAPAPTPPRPIAKPSPPSPPAPHFVAAPSGPTVNDVLAHSPGPKRSNRVLPEPADDDEPIESRARRSRSAGTASARLKAARESQREEPEIRDDSTDDAPGRVLRVGMKPLPAPWENDEDDRDDAETDSPSHRYASEPIDDPDPDEDIAQDDGLNDADEDLWTRNDDAKSELDDANMTDEEWDDDARDDSDDAYGATG